MEDDVDQQTENNEHATIGALILASDRVRALMLGMLTDNDITQPKCLFLLDTIRNMVNEQVPVNEVTIAGYISSRGLMRPGAPRIAASSLIHQMVTSAPTPYTGPWYAALAVEARARRTVRYGGLELVRVADAGSFTELKGIITTVTAGALAALDRAEQAANFHG